MIVFSAHVKLFKSSCRFSLLAIAFSLSCSLAAAQTGNDVQNATQEVFAHQTLPRAFSCPAPSGTGDVPLRIVIDPKGNVSEAKALGGTENRVSAAVACAKTWKYENPQSAPIAKTVVLRYESKDCSAAESQHGEAQYSWNLRNQSNLELAYIEGEQPPAPPYPEEERKAGIAGKLVLSVSLNADGTVKDLKVAKGLSPRLDKEVTDKLRSLKFKVLDGVSEMQLQDLFFQIIFHATCITPKIINYAE